MKKKVSFYEMLDADEMVNDYQFTKILDSVAPVKNAFRDDKKMIRNRLHDC